jgi:integrase
MRTKGYIFPNVGSKPIHPSNFLRREFHPLLKAAGIPRCGFHGCRRYRNTYPRNVAGCPDGPLKYWMGHSGRDMSDLYDQVREDPWFRKARARTMGVGFKVPTKLKAEETKPRKNVVRRVVSHSQSETQKQQIAP